MLGSKYVIPYDLSAYCSETGNCPPNTSATFFLARVSQRPVITDGGLVIAPRIFQFASVPPTDNSSGNVPPVRIESSWDTEWDLPGNTTVVVPALRSFVVDGTLDVNRTRFTFAPNETLTVNGEMNSSYGTFTATDPAQGWDGVHYAAGASGDFYDSRIFNVGNDEPIIVTTDGLRPPGFTSTISGPGVNVEVALSNVATVPASSDWRFSGIRVEGAYNVGLDVEGDLQAEETTFTASNPAQGWDGIHFKSGSSGIIESGFVEYAKTRYWHPGHGITITDASSPYHSITIKNVKIRENSNAVYVTGVAQGMPLIKENQIYDNGGGIILANQARAEIVRNTVYNNSGDAFAAGYLTYPYLYENVLLNNTGEGVEAVSAARTWLGRYYNSDTGYNVVQNNDGGGVSADGNASVRAGTSIGNGQNSFLNNGSTQAASRWHDGIGPDALATLSGVAYARSNWWGRPADPDTTTCLLSSPCGAGQYSGVLYVDPMLTAVPSGPSSSASGGPNVAVLGAARVTTGEGSPAEAPRTMRDRLLAAVSAAERPADALSDFQAIVASTPDHRLAAVALAEAARLADPEGEPVGLRPFLTASAAVPDARRQAWGRRALVVYHELRDEADAALAHATALAEQTGAGEAAWFGHEARVYLLADAGRLDEAVSALAALEAGPPDRAGTAHARQYLAFLGAVPASGSPERVEGRTVAAQAESDGSAFEHALGAAYPNPVGANAVTVPFEVADGARVRLALYDALGREVAAVAEGHYGGGVHEAGVEVGRLPGGAYLIRAVFEGDDGQRHVETRRLTVVR